MLTKNKKKWRIFSLVILVAGSLFACSDEEHLRDLHAYIDNLKKTITRHKMKNILAGMHMPSPVVFQPNDKQRDPFEDEQASYNGAELNSPLTAFPVKSFEFVGTIIRKQQSWAIIQAPDHKIYQVTIKDRIGNHYGRIIGINPDQIKVEEEVSPQDSGEVSRGQGLIKRIVTLQLKGGD